MVRINCQRLSKIVEGTCEIRRRYDLLLVDINISHMNGFELSELTYAHTIFNISLWELMTDLQAFSEMLAPGREKRPIFQEYSY